MLSKLLARNLRCPDGLFGAILGGQMNRANRAMNRAAVACLAPAPDDQVLEIGFGGGAGLKSIASHLQSGRIVGVDISETMRTLVSRRFGELISCGRVELLRGEAENLPCADGSFDRALTVNTLYFWRDPARVANEVMRVLRPGGTFLVAFRPKEVMQRFPFTRHGFSMYADEEVYTLLHEAGFSEIRFSRGDDDRVGYVCACARKPD